MMIRDSTKLLCRIVEEFENTAKRNRGETLFTPNRRGLATPVVMAGLTDRTEWPDCSLKCFYYGTELNKGFKRQNFVELTDPIEGFEGGFDNITGSREEKDDEKSVMVTISGEGSPVEEFVKTLQLDGKVIPDRIMITGTLSTPLPSPPPFPSSLPLLPPPPLFPSSLLSSSFPLLPSPSPPSSLSTEADISKDHPGRELLDTAAPGIFPFKRGPYATMYSSKA